MKSLRFLPAATADLASAAAWYETRAPGTGRRLVEAVNTALEFAVSNPKMFPAMGGVQSRRRARIAGFPYALVFEERGDELVIVAVAHARRRPGFHSGRR